MENKNEQWKYIPDYGKYYMVSNTGIVKSMPRTIMLKNGIYRNINGKILSKRLGVNGYLFVTLSKNGTYKHTRIHQLVAIAFLNHKIDGHTIVVDHIDNNKQNNNLDNLQLISQRENCSKETIGTSKYTGVSYRKSRKKWRSQIRINGRLIHIGYFDSEYDAHFAYQKYLSNHCNTG